MGPDQDHRRDGAAPMPDDGQLLAHPYQPRAAERPGAGAAARMLRSLADALDGRGTPDSALLVLLSPRSATGASLPRSLRVVPFEIHDLLCADRGAVVVTRTTDRARPVVWSCPVCELSFEPSPFTFPELRAVGSTARAGTRPSGPSAP